MHHSLVYWFAILGPPATWIFNNIITNAVSSIPAPTKDSTPTAVWWFQFLNRFVGNVQRAKNSRIEDSPNWRDAVDQHIATNYPELASKRIDTPEK